KVVQQFADREAEGNLDQATAPDVAGELEGQRPARAPHAVLLVVRAALVEDDGHARQGDHVVDYRGFAEEAFDSRQRGLETHHAALAFEAFEQGSLLSADVCARPAADFDMEGLARAEEVTAQIAARLCHAYRVVQRDLG